MPYMGRRPASVSINGHRLVILAHDRDTLEEDLDLLGADRVKTFTLGENPDEHDTLIGKIARQVDGGVVIAPEGVNLREVLKNLESELPWVQ